VKEADPPVGAIIDGRLLSIAISEKLDIYYTVC
jgi:hypothetical protein